MIAVVAAEHLDLVQAQLVVARIVRGAVIERAVEAGDDLVDHDLAVAGRIGGRAARERIRCRARSRRCGSARRRSRFDRRHNRFRTPPTPTRARPRRAAWRLPLPAQIACPSLARSPVSLKCCKAHSASGRASGSHGQFLTPSITRVRCRPEEMMRRLHPALICTGVLLLVGCSISESVKSSFESSASSSAARPEAPRRRANRTATRCATTRRRT